MLLTTNKNTKQELTNSYNWKKKKKINEGEITHKGEITSL